MDAERLARIQEIFYEALERSEPERAGFLDAACAGDADLRRAVDRYLRADADADDAFLAAPLADLNGPPPGLEAVGPYRVLRPLGSGGMGEVYLAVREKPFRQYVALKVMRAGTDSPTALARFANERQILASLDHPGIARILDGGVTSDHRPYFAMEYVEGRPITTYCDENRLSVDERLRLFVQVCQSVHYAHQNLVLHRDIKPSNIFVASRGAGAGNAQVKLLDFGIAKLLNPQFNVLTLPVTRPEARPMTPEYASPEQIRGEPLTTTSDLYSLGVLLYELLVGRPPFVLHGRSSQEMLRIVSNDAPTSPSSALLRGGADLDDAAPARGVHEDRLYRRLRGDLDAICLKALRKEPSHRYASAELLAQDVERHLAREPVAARRGSRRYRMASFLRRHRVGAIVTTVVAAALMSGFGVAVWQARAAAAEQERAEQVAAFMMDLMGDFDPNNAQEGLIDAVELVDRAVYRVETTLAAQPEVQARLYTHLGKLYTIYARYPSAERVHRLALGLRRDLHGEVHPDVAESLNYVAWMRFVQGAHEEADSLYRRSLDLQDRLPSPVMLTRTATLNELALVRNALGDREGGLALAREAYTIREEELGPDDRVVVTALNDLAAMLQAMGRHDEAAPLLRRVVEQRRLSGMTLETAQALNDYGLVLTIQGKHEEASEAYQESLAIRTNILGGDHPQVAQSLSHLGWALQTQGRAAEAEPLYRRALAIRRELFGASHTSVGNSLLMLGEVRLAQGAADEGLALAAEAVQIFRQVLGPEHVTTLNVQLRYARRLAEAGRREEAHAVATQTRDVFLRTLGPDHERTNRAETLVGELTSDE